MTKPAIRLVVASWACFFTHDRTRTGADLVGSRRERELLIIELKDGHWEAMRGLTYDANGMKGLATPCAGDPVGAETIRRSGDWQA